VYLFGDPADGRLASPSSKVQMNCSSLGGERARAVYCGGAHTHVLTESLEVYSFGCNKKGQLGLTRSDFQYFLHSSLDQPMKVDYLTGKGVCHLAVGGEHSLALTLNGLVYAWGANQKGQLGICTLGPNFMRVGLPRLLENLASEPAVYAACGHRTSYLVVVRKHPESGTKLFKRWTKSLVQADRAVQERANYRYSLARREINKAKLRREVQEERRSPGVSVRSTSVSRRSSPISSYYAFWDSASFIDKQDSTRRVHIFPIHKRGRSVVTVFAPPRTASQTTQHFPTLSQSLQRNPMLL